MDALHGSESPAILRDDKQAWKSSINLLLRYGRDDFQILIACVLFSTSNSTDSSVLGFTHGSKFLIQRCIRTCVMRQGRPPGKQSFLSRPLFMREAGISSSHAHKRRH